MPSKKKSPAKPKAKKAPAKPSLEARIDEVIADLSELKARVDDLIQNKLAITEAAEADKQIDEGNAAYAAAEEAQAE